MHIFYHESNGVLYARLGRSVRNGDKVSKESINLGRVIDKEKGIYKSRERGVFQYDLETDTYTSIAQPEGRRELSLPGISHGTERSIKAEKAIVDLGDVFFLDAFIKKAGLDAVIDGAGYEDRDTLYALLCHRLLGGGDDRRAEDWCAGSYAGILYPHAQLSGEQIREVYAALGGELSRQLFFSRYLPYVSERGASDRTAAESMTAKRSGAKERYVLIDSAADRGGRLLYVVRQSTGMPVFFRYCQDKEADVETLVRTIRELEVYKIVISLAILDAGYYSGDSIEELYAQRIAFLTKPREDLRLYKKLATESLSALTAHECFVSCDVQYPYIKCVPCKVGQKNHPACAYVCLALDKERLETYRQLLDAKNRSLTDGDMHDMIQSQEILLFVSSERIAPDKLFPAYETRRYMERFLRGLGADRSDGRAGARSGGSPDRWSGSWPDERSGGSLDGQPGSSPDRWSGGSPDGLAGGRSAPRSLERAEDMLCGQLLLTFMADVIREQIEDKLASMPYTLEEMFLNLRNQKGKVYRDRVIAQKASKKASDCYKRFGILCPTEIRR